MTDSKTLPPPPSPLPSSIRLLLALASLCATKHQPVRWPSAWYQPASSTWLRSVCKLLSIDTTCLPPAIEEAAVRASAEEQREEWMDDERLRIAGVLVEASLASEAEENKENTENKEQALRYTPIARALAHRALDLLGLPTKEILPEAERKLSATLFKALQASQAEAEQKVESTRAAHSQGWGGALGRHLATGAGVVAGGVLIGVTGGLAAPAIAALLAPLGVGSILTASAAPVVLGTLFGVGGGGLAGRRVRERWKGVEEFSFIEVGSGTKSTQEEVDDLKAARERYKAREKAKAEEGEQGTEFGNDATTEKKDTTAVPVGATVPSPAPTATASGPSEEDESEEDAVKRVERDRADMEEKLLDISMQSGTRSSITSENNTPRTSLDGSPRPSLDKSKEDKDLAEAKKPPSLTATIVVPGLLTVSRTEAITAWRAVCAQTSPPSLVNSLNYEAPEKPQGDLQTIDERKSDGTAFGGFKDGRDVYLLRFESATMLKTGRDIDHWVATKLKGKIKSEIIKRTLLNAYFAAVSLPMSVYSMATMSLDNTWMQAQDRASKAGRILGEVLEKRVQGERPVVLIGSSLGALTVLKALLYLASMPAPDVQTSAIPSCVESAYLISLPSAPTAEEWAKVRGVVARRVVNAWSDADFVLAGVVRLHEVVSRAATLSNGVKVAGLGPVEQPGVQDVDVSSVLRGHLEIQTKVGEVLRIIEVDA